MDSGVPKNGVLKSLEQSFAKGRWDLWIVTGIAALMAFLLYDFKVSEGGDDSAYISRAFDLLKIGRFPSFQGLHLSDLPFRFDRGFRIETAAFEDQFGCIHGPVLSLDLSIASHAHPNRSAFPRLCAGRHEPFAALFCLTDLFRGLFSLSARRFSFPFSKCFCGRPRSACLESTSVGCALDLAAWKYPDRGLCESARSSFVLGHGPKLDLHGEDHRIILRCFFGHAGLEDRSLWRRSSSVLQSGRNSFAEDPIHRQMVRKMSLVSSIDSQAMPICI